MLALQCFQIFALSNLAAHQLITALLLMGLPLNNSYKQFVIRNASLVRSYANVIKFCNGDLNPNTKQTTRRG